MTRSDLRLLEALAPLITDLADDLPAERRYRRLLEAVQRLLPCDSVALLRLEGEALAPVAIEGLSPDTLGRRFRVDAHPRLRTLLQTEGAVLFAPDCGLPDPYDGLIQGGTSGLEVHDCMGCALRIDERIWGVLTLDALEAGRFSRTDLRLLETFAKLAAATVAAATRLDSLNRGIEDARRRVEAYRLAVHAAPRPFLGRSPAFGRMMAEIELVAPSGLSVLVIGETGTGKELVARELHERSPRRDKPLVSLNCAALPEHLVESELFGHVRGAFSGAVSDRPGKFETADGGTLFLDEIGELPLPAQAKLLRVLQDGQLQRVGSDREHRADVRLIAATNRDLAEEVRARRFRADLYHRLCTYPLHLPPLRERGRDVLLLAGAFLEEDRRRMGLRGLRLSSRAQAALLAHDWPGNVRELEHLIARATLRAKGRLPARERQGIATLEAADLDLDAGPDPASDAARPDAPTTGEPAPAHAATMPGSVHPTPEPRTAWHETVAPQTDLRGAVDAFQRRLITEALTARQGNVAATARDLGVDRANLMRLSRRLGISTTPLRAPGARPRRPVQALLDQPALADRSALVAASPHAPPRADEVGEDGPLSDSPARVAP